LPVIKKKGQGGVIGDRKPMSDIDKYFALERKKHFDFYLPFYVEKNWQVETDNINSGQKNDWDVKLEVFAGQYVLVDEKVRIGEFDDFLVEIIQDMVSGSLGWFFNKKDWILYGSWGEIENTEPTSLYLIKEKELKNYVYSLDGFKKICISKKGFGITWNLKLEWEDLINKGIAKKLL